MSSDFFRRGRERFEVDRKTKKLDPSDTDFLRGQLRDPDDLVAWQKWMTELTHYMTQHMGLLDHHRPGYDRHVNESAIQTLRRLAPWPIAQPNRPHVVHFFKIVDASWDLPKTLVDEESKRYSHTTLHLCRLSNSPYSLDMYVDVLHIVLQAPAGVIPLLSLSGLPPPLPSSTTADGSMQDKMSGKREGKEEKQNLDDDLDTKMTDAEQRWDRDQQANTEQTPLQLRKADREKFEKERKIEEKNGDTTSATPPKKKQRKSTKHDKVLPIGWQTWNITHKMVHTRILVYKLPLMTMSNCDPRANFDGRKDASVHADWVDHGGCFHKDDAKIYMPLQEGLLWNHRFIFTCSRAADHSGGVNWDWPDLSEPFEVRHQKSIIGYYAHETEKIKMELRSSHSRRAARSTATASMHYEPFNRYEVSNGHTIWTRYQFQPGGYSPTIPFLAGGVELHEIHPFIRQVAGPHWYPDPFNKILGRMLAHHPNDIKTWEDASVFLADLSNENEATTGSFGATKKKSVPKTRAKKIEIGQNWMLNDFCPMIGLHRKYRAKRMFVWAAAIWQIMMKACGFRPPDKKDSFQNARSEIVGLMHSSFQRRSLGDFRKRIDTNLRLELKNQPKLRMENVFDGTWTQKIDMAMSSGIWSPDRKQIGKSRKDAAMQLKCYNQYGHLGHTGRSNSANTTQRKSNTSKQVDPFSWGYQCAAETPEGSQCGVVHHKTASSSVTAGSSMRVLIAILWHALGPDILIPIDHALFDGVMDTHPNLALRVTNNPHYLPVHSACLVADPPDFTMTEAFQLRKRKKEEAKMRAVQKRAQKRAKQQHVQTSESSNTTTASGKSDIDMGKSTKATISDESKQSAPTSVSGSRTHPALYQRYGTAREETSPAVEANAQKWTTIYVNGSPEWRTQKPQAVLSMVRHLRQVLALDPYTSAHGQDFEIYIRTDIGRNVRPLVNLSRWIQAMRSTPNLRAQYLWNFHWSWQRGIIEYVDPEEEPATVIAFDVEDFCRRSQIGEQFTHMEPDPRLIFSLVTLMCSFLDHNQGARAVLHNATLKQACTNPTNLLEQNLARFSMHYAQRSPCWTAPVRDYHLQDVSGVQLINQLFYNHRQNQEDADVYCRTSQDFLLWNSSKTRTCVTGSRVTKRQAAQNQSSQQLLSGKGTGSKTIQFATAATVAGAEPSKNAPTSSSSVLAEFGNPMLNKGRTTILRSSAYDKAEDNGMPMIGQFLRAGEVAIGRTYQIGSTQDGSIERFDDSLTVKNGEDGTVISTLAIQNEAGTVEIRKVEKRTLIVADLGDKFSSKHGQKGVAGLWVRRTQLPLSQRDLVAPSRASSISAQIGRLSEGHQFELQETTVCVRTGHFMDATVFKNPLKERERKQIYDFARKHKIPLHMRSGYIHPETGELMAPMAFGVLPVFQLKHFAHEKDHHRSIGPIQLLTHQPTEGRARDGGHKLGHMEAANLDGTGSAEISQERLVKESDGRIVDYCQQCTQMAVRNDSIAMKWCQQCFTDEHIISIRGPHAHMLCQQEWFCMGYMQNMTFVDEKVPVSYIQRADLERADKPYPQSEWAKLMQLPRLRPYEHRRLGTRVPETLHTFLQSLPSIHLPISDRERSSKRKLHVSGSDDKDVEMVPVDQLDQVDISPADASALLVGDVPKTTKGRTCAGPEAVLAAVTLAHSRPPPNVVAWYHEQRHKLELAARAKVEPQLDRPQLEGKQDLDKPKLEQDSNSSNPPSHSVGLDSNTRSDPSPPDPSRDALIRVRKRKSRDDDKLEG